MQVGAYTLTSNGKQDGFIIKYNGNGEAKWATSIGESSSDYIYSVVETQDGKIIAGGNFWGTIQVGDHKLDRGGGIIKYSSTGKVEWATSISRNSYNNAINSITETKDGGIVAGGNFSGTMQVGDYMLTSKGDNDGFVVKYTEKELANPETVDAVSIGESGDDTIECTIATTDGGYVVGGTFYGTMQVGDYLLTSKGKCDVFIIKYDSRGEVVWVRSFGGSDIDYVYSVEEALDRGYVVVGFFKYQTMQVGDYTLTNKGVDDGFIIKYKENGEVEWARSFGGSDTDRINSVVVTKDGGYIAGGDFSGITQVGNYTLTSKGSYDELIIKYSSTGEVEWVTSVGGNDWNEIISVLVTNNDGIVSLGKFKGTMQVGDYTLTNKGVDDGFIIKYSSTGKVEWMTSVGGSGDDYINSGVVTKDGGIIAGGNFSGTMQVGAYTLTSNGYNDGFIIKYDKNGEVEWAKSVGGSSSDYINSVSETKDGGIVAVGNFGGTIQVGNYTLTNNGSNDGFIIKYDSNGEVEWAKSIGGSGSDNISSIAELNDGSIIAGGHFASSTLESDGKILTNKGGKDGMLLKIVNYTGVPEVQELTVENKRKELKITTDVNEIDGIKGGNISGEDLKPYETVKYGGNSTKEIKMLPDQDYEIIGITVNGKEYPFIANEDGTYTMPTFDNMMEGKHVVVTYSLKDNKITINKVDSYTKDKLTGAKFRLDQIEERVKPQNVVGSLTDNSNTFYEYNLSEEVTGTLGELTNNGTYYFVKNADGTLTPTNSKTYQLANGGSAGIQSVTANSYIPIDLTGKTGTYAVKVNAKISSERNYDFGYATITENTTAPAYSNETGRFIYTSGTESAKDYISATLDGGKVYYLHLGYRKDGSGDSNEDQIVINSINVYKAEQIESRYNFIEESGEYKSTNQGKSNTTSNSYIPIDLTGYTGKYNLSLKAKVSSDGSDYGYATVTTTETAPAYNSSDGRFVYISGTSTSVTTAKEYTTVLQGGNKYYLHLGYYKNASTDTGDDTFTVSDIRVTLNDSELYHVDIETNSEGQAITQIPFGKYNLTEIVTPEGYEKQTAPIEIEFRSDGTRKVIKCAEEVEENGNIIKSPNVTVNENGEFVVENISTAKVIVEHYIKGTETKLADDVILEGKQGEDYTTSPLLNLEKYELEKDETGEYVIPTNAFGTYTQETIIVKYYYVAKEIPLIVHHYIEGTENRVPLKDGSLAEDVTDFGTENAPYTTEPISNDNLSVEYELVELPTNKDGVYSGEEVIVIYYYKKVERNIVIQKYSLVKEKNEETGEETVTEVPLEGAKFQITESNPEINYICTEPIQNNAEYYFEKQEDSYISNNKNIQNSVSNSFIKIDTTEIAGDVGIVINATVSSEQNYDFGYAIITESSDNPFSSIRRSLQNDIETNTDMNADTESYAIIKRPMPFIAITGELDAQNYSTSIGGGKVYYLHFGYYKDNVDLDPVGNDTFTINSVSINGTNISLDENNDVEYVAGFSEEHITDSNGKITTKLEVGKYNITEKEAPEGYVLPENPTTQIEVTKDTVDGDIIKIVNNKIKGKVIVHHYVMEYDGTLTATPVPLIDGTEAQDEIKEGYIGDRYATKEKDNLATNWKFIKAEGKTSGEYTEETIEVTYYYQEQINIEDTISIEVTKKWIDNDIQALRRPSTIKFKVVPYVELSEEETVIKEETVSGEILSTNDAETKVDLEKNIEDNTSDNDITEENKAQDNTLITEDKEQTSEDNVNNMASEINTQEKTMQNTVDTKTEENTVNEETEIKQEISQEEIVGTKESEVKKEGTEQTNTKEITNLETPTTETNEVAQVVENNEVLSENHQEVTENLSVETLEEYVFEFPNQAVNKEEKTKTYTLNGILKYDQTTGKKIRYKVLELEEKEGDLDFYERTEGLVSEEVDEAGNIKYVAEIVNTFKVLDDAKDVKVTKIWKDNNSAFRPESIKIELVGRVKDIITEEKEDGTKNLIIPEDATKEIESEKEEAVIQSIANQDTYVYTFHNKKIYDYDGQEIEYGVDEKEGNGSLDKYIKTITSDETKSEFTITNTLIVQDSKITKIGPEEIRAIDSKVPYVIDYTVELDEKYEDNANIELVDTLEYEVIPEKSDVLGGNIGEDNKTITWIGTYDANKNNIIWDNDTQDKITTTITYDEEKAVKIITIHMEISVAYKSIPLGCEKVINKVSGTVTLSNNVTDKKEATCETPTRWVKDVVVNKLWNGDTEETRPDSINIELKLITQDENGNEVLEGMKGFNTTITPTLTESGTAEWTYTYKDLPRYDAEGNEFNYTVDETGINYTKGEQAVENKYYCEKAEEIKDGNTIITLTNNVYGSITVTKVDSRKEDVKLKGAEFKLERVIKEVNEEGKINWCVPEEGSEDYFVTTGTTGDEGTLKFENLKYGFYKLTETKAPEDYRISKEEIKVIEVNSSDEEHLNAKVTVGNDKKYSLPLTGGYGTNIVRSAIALMGITALILITNRKKVIPERRVNAEKIIKPVRRK